MQVHRHPPTAPPPGALCCYSGTITAYIRHGVFELDGGAHALLLSAHSAGAHGRGMRVGTRVAVFNAHALRTPRGGSALGCCVYSHVTPVAFPRLAGSWYVPQGSRTAAWWRRLDFARFCWLVDAAATFRAGKFRGDSITMVEAAGACLRVFKRAERDLFVEFYAHHYGDTAPPASSVCSCEPPALPRVPALLTFVHIGPLASALACNTPDRVWHCAVFHAAHFQPALALAGILKVSHRGALWLCDSSARLQVVLVAGSSGSGDGGGQGVWLQPFHLGRLAVVCAFQWVVEKTGVGRTACTNNYLTVDPLALLVAPAGASAQPQRTPCPLLHEHAIQALLDSLVLAAGREAASSSVPPIPPLVVFLSSLPQFSSWRFMLIKVLRWSQVMDSEPDSTNRWCLVEAVALSCPPAQGCRPSSSTAPTPPAPAQPLLLHLVRAATTVWFALCPGFFLLASHAFSPCARDVPDALISPAYRTVTARWTVDEEATMARIHVQDEAHPSADRAGRGCVSLPSSVFQGVARLEAALQSLSPMLSFADILLWRKHDALGLFSCEGVVLSKADVMGPSEELQTILQIIEPSGLNYMNVKIQGLGFVATPAGSLVRVTNMRKTPTASCGLAVETTSLTHIEVLSVPDGSYGAPRLPTPPLLSSDAAQSSDAFGECLYQYTDTQACTSKSTVVLSIQRHSSHAWQGTDQHRPVFLNIFHDVAVPASSLPGSKPTAPPTTLASLVHMATSGAEVSLAVCRLRCALVYPFSLAAAIRCRFCSATGERCPCPGGTTLAGTALVLEVKGFLDDGTDCLPFMMGTGPAISLFKLTPSDIERTHRLLLQAHRAFLGPSGVDDALRFLAPRVYHPSARLEHVMHARPELKAVSHKRTWSGQPAPRIVLEVLVVSACDARWEAHALLEKIHSLRVFSLDAPRSST